jgi:hypothetical protein
MNQEWESSETGLRQHRTVVTLLKKFVSKADGRFAAVDEQIKLLMQYADVNEFVNDLCNIIALLKECVMRSEIKYKVRHPAGYRFSLWGIRPPQEII